MSVDRSMRVKVYLVLQRVNLPGPDGHNVKVLEGALTRSKAEEVREDNPGTWIKKITAGK